MRVGRSSEEWNFSLINVAFAIVDVIMLGLDVTSKTTRKQKIKNENLPALRHRGRTPDSLDRRLRLTLRRGFHLVSLTSRLLFFFSL